MGTATANFSYSEFGCQCGSCHYVDGYQIDPKLILNLQKIRNVFGKPIKINSGLRCHDHNRSVGGVDGSYHVVGRAVDIPCTDSEDRHQLVKLALRLNLTVGINPKFIHLDNRDSPIIFLY